jgi:hypothetical protein
LGIVCLKNAGKHEVFMEDEHEKGAEKIGQVGGKVITGQVEQCSYYFCD